MNQLFVQDVKMLIVEILEMLYLIGSMLVFSQVTMYRRCTIAPFVEYTTVENAILQDCSLLLLFLYLIFYIYYIYPYIYLCILYLYNFTIVSSHVNCQDRPRPPEDRSHLRATFFDAPLLLFSFLLSTHFSLLFTSIHDSQLSSFLQFHLPLLIMASGEVHTMNQTPQFAGKSIATRLLCSLLAGCSIATAASDPLVHSRPCAGHEDDSGSRSRIASHSDVPRAGG